MKVKAIIFDLDGTLVDSVPALSKAMNEILIKYNFPTHSQETYKGFIGNGIKALVEQSVPDIYDTELLEKMYKEKSALYEQYWKEGTTLFPGIEEMLYSLQEKQITMAIFSNKEDVFTQQIVAHFLHRWPFIKIIGRTNSIPKKPDPTGLLNIMNGSTIPLTEWGGVGDKDADIEAAIAAGITPFWVSWGYQHTAPKEAIILNNPQELLSYI
jgi:phosphoglycolate phosphatase